MDHEAVFAELIGLLYEAAGDPALWPRALDKLAGFLGGTGIALFVQDFNEGRGSAGNLGFAATARMDPAYIKSFDEHYNTVNVWVEKMRTMEPGVPASDVALFPRDRLKRTEWYGDWLKPQGYDASMGVSLTKMDGLALNLTVHRPDSVGDFGNVELRALKSLAPHIQRAVALHAKLSELQQWKAASFQALERLRLGVVLFDDRGRVIFANGSARKTIDDGRAFRLERDGRVAASRANVSRRLHSAIESAVNPSMHDAEKRFRVKIDPGAGGSTIDLTVLPLPRFAAGLPGRVFGGGPAAVLFITDPDRQVDLQGTALIEQYGFTAAEALLAQALVRGSTLDQYAASRSITRNTVMTQLKAVMAKTGTARQVDVVIAILLGPASVLFDPS